MRNSQKENKSWRLWPRRTYSPRSQECEKEEREKIYKVVFTASSHSSPVFPLKETADVRKQRLLRACTLSCGLGQKMFR